MEEKSIDTIEFDITFIIAMIKKLNGKNPLELNIVENFKPTKLYNNTSYSDTVESIASALGVSRNKLNEHINPSVFEHIYLTVNEKLNELVNNSGLNFTEFNFKCYSVVKVDELKVTYSYK